MMFQAKIQGASSGVRQSWQRAAFVAVIAVVAAGGMCGASAVAVPATVDSANPQGQLLADQFLKQLPDIDGTSLKGAVAKLLPASYEPLHRALTDSALDRDLHARLEAAFPAILRALQPRYEIIAQSRRWEADIQRKTYEGGPNRDARWDNLVRAGFDLWRNPPPYPPKPEYYRACAGAWQKAISAGCNDPIAKLIFVSSQSLVAGTDRGEWRRLSLEAAEGLENGDYSAVCRLRGYFLTAKVLQAVSKKPDDDRAILMHLYDLSMVEWPRLIANTDLPDPLLIEFSTELLKNAKDLQFESDRMKHLVNDAIRKALPERAAADFLDGNYDIEKTWESRGFESAANVSDVRMREALKWNQAARACLEKAWIQDPTNPQTCVQMIRVELLDSKGRPTMEKWFQRAMAADANCRDACVMKLNYLQPRWYGSYDEMLAFGHECAAIHNSTSGLPYLLINVHRVIAEETGEGEKHFAKPAVWADVQDVYEAGLKANPRDALARNMYANLAAISGHWQVANAQFKVIGDQPDLNVFGTRKNYDDLRRAAAIQPGAGQPPSPPDHGSK